MAEAGISHPYSKTVGLKRCVRILGKMEWLTSHEGWNRRIDAKQV